MEKILLLERIFARWRFLLVCTSGHYKYKGYARNERDPVFESTRG
jgi:hypothetical protein